MKLGYDIKGLVGIMETFNENRERPFLNNNNMILIDVVSVCISSF
jgi:hypothetical protein